MTHLSTSETPVYQGQFGDFTITKEDRLGVIIYRTGLGVAALTFALATTLVLEQGNTPTAISALTPLYAVFCLALGVSLFTIHIYMAVLHRALQLFWLIGVIAAVGFALYFNEPLAVIVSDRPLTLFGIGFTFAALTGIYFKEAFCFNRLETKFLTPLVPLLMLGHIAGVLSAETEQVLLAIWALLFLVFSARKMVQDIPADIGDKSVFDYLKKQRSAKA